MASFFCVWKQGELFENSFTEDQEVWQVIRMAVWKIEKYIVIFNYVIINFYLEPYQFCRGRRK